MTPGATLARIRLNTASREVQRDLRDATQLHRTLMRLVPDDLGATPRHDTGLLYRVEQNARDTTILVQATCQLAPERLSNSYGQVDIKDLEPMLRAMRANLAVRYRIVLNPVKRERLPLDKKNQRGKVIPLSGAEADQWWARRATEAGLHLRTLQATPLNSPMPRREAPRIRHSLIRYDGTATVTDPKMLTLSLLAGIGRAKSYGAGLLSLAPAHVS
ncbi:type I-E CRISPR-associated protein Cas6/Cse3/CasE [Kitasatospora sp. NPDC058965]|uniref:type I-E CRISPR-associated protein Cas6/Cse3/CasE n=1 Tax=Kitasatospora sp. NPDC058965 TaxID=3346682 RepID=UPI0036926D04